MCQTDAQVWWYSIYRNFTRVGPVQPLVGGAIQLLQARFWERVAGRLALSLVATLGDHALQNFEHLAVWERWY